MNQDLPEEFASEVRILLYMDILGTKRNKNTADSTEGGPFIRKVIQRLTSMKRQFDVKYDKSEDGTHTIKELGPEISSFSDHIAISYPASTFTPLGENSINIALFHIINIASYLHGCAIQQRVLMRGAITVGDLWHKNGDIEGIALEKADNLEKHTAVYPRVIFSTEALRLYSSNTHIAKSFACQQDINDGLYFVNYLIDPNCWGWPKDENEKFFIGLRALILQQLDSYANDEHKFAKWYWLAQKFNDALDHLTRNYPDKLKHLKQVPNVNWKI